MKNSLQKENEEEQAGRCDEWIILLVCLLPVIIFTLLVFFYPQILSRLLF